MDASLLPPRRLQMRLLFAPGSAVPVYAVSSQMAALLNGRRPSRNGIERIDTPVRPTVAQMLSGASSGVVQCCEADLPCLPDSEICWPAHPSDRIGSSCRRKLFIAICRRERHGTREKEFGHAFPGREPLVQSRLRRPAIEHPPRQVHLQHHHLPQSPLRRAPDLSSTRSIGAASGSLWVIQAYSRKRPVAQSAVSSSRRMWSHQRR